LHGTARTKSILTARIVALDFPFRVIYPSLPGIDRVSGIHRVSKDFK
jgi:hypothetical protein